MTGKGERETYTQLRIAKRGKKVFLREQCKEIEENNRMGKTRDFFMKIRDTKGTFHAKMGSIKDRNGTDLTEAVEDPDNHNSVITHLEPDTLDCEVRWTLRKNHYERS